MTSYTMVYHTFSTDGIGTVHTSDCIGRLVNVVSGMKYYNLGDFNNISQAVTYAKRTHDRVWWCRYCNEDVITRDVVCIEKSDDDTISSLGFLEDGKVREVNAGTAISEIESATVAYWSNDTDGDNRTYVRVKLRGSVLYLTTEIDDKGDNNLLKKESCALYTIAK